MTNQPWALRGGILLGGAVIGVPAVFDSAWAIIPMVGLVALGLLLQARAGRRSGDAPGRGADEGLAEPRER